MLFCFPPLFCHMEIWGFDGPSHKVWNEICELQNSTHIIFTLVFFILESDKVHSPHREQLFIYLFIYVMFL